jgi:hypothetical protein
MTSDELFKSISYDMERYSQVFTDAQKVKKGYEGADRSVRSIADEMLAGPQAHLGLPQHQINALQEAGVKQAREMTFQSKLEGGAVLDALGTFEHFVSKHKGFRVLFPFVRTPVNIAVKALELNPITAALSSRFRKELWAGGARQNKALAQMAMGSSLSVLLYQKWAAGELQGTGSGNNSARLDGKNRYSVKLFGTNVKYDRLDPFGMIIGFHADLFDLFETYQLTPQMEREAGSVLFGVMAAFSANITNKTYMRGLSELVEAMSYAEQGAPNAFAKLSSSTLMTMLPIVGSNFERRRASDIEEFSKYIFNWKDEFISRIPEGSAIAGLLGVDRGDLGTRMDPLGRPVETPEQLGPDSRLWNPIDVTPDSKDPLMRALAELDFHISMPTRNISGVKLDGPQYSKLLYIRGQEIRIAGMTLEERLRKETQSVIFRALPEQGRHDRVNDLVRQYGREAVKKLLAEDQQLNESVKLMRNDRRSRKEIQLQEALGIDGEVDEAPSDILKDGAEALEKMTGQSADLQAGEEAGEIMAQMQELMAKLMPGRPS